MSVVITEKIICEPVGGNVSDLRTLFCVAARDKYEEHYNPLSETNFNELLEAVGQACFEAGRNYERQKQKG